jgi:hypothetical protein
MIQGTNFAKTSLFRLSKKTDQVSLLHTASDSQRPLPAAVPRSLHWRRKKHSDRNKSLVSNVYQLATTIYHEVRAEFWLEAKALGSIQNIGNKLWLTTAGSGKQRSQDTPLNPACFPHLYPWPTTPLWGTATSASMGNTSTGR